MGLLKVLNHVERCYSNEDGAVIHALLLSELKSDEKVTLSFEDIEWVTSSFVNTALIDLLEEFDFSYIKSHLKFTKTTKQINDMIKRRFKFEVEERKKLIHI
ncbi:STAS-like domain-containing protein [Halobacillus sp. Cin3]|uniref:STAS-like domain-containing protein n=1 Tax=Halobacillus sp. Cin3 TaxID=2928441 RepID=UPI00248E5676|nr:STAS-like domain-containing protein [Halobacillus sp. Cin3]